MSKVIRSVMMWLIALVFWLLAQALAAEGTMASVDEVESGTLLLRFEEESGGRESGGRPAHGDFQSQWVAPQLHSSADIRVTGPLVRVVLTQVFSNPSDYWAEGVYVFPLPENAAVDHMRMTIGQRVIEGQIKEREAAKKVYQKAKQSGRRASLVEQERPNIFTTSVANIPPGESIEVSIEYQHEAALESRRYSLRFPMTITPRYTPGARFPPTGTGSGDLLAEQDRAPHAESLDRERGASTSNRHDADLAPKDVARITPPWGLAHENHNPTEVSVSLQPGFELEDIESRYHQVSSSSHGPNHWQVTLPADSHHANADFVLEWWGREMAVPQSQLFTESHRGSDYGLLILTPPELDVRAQRLPRDITYVIDTSGSMGGESLRQAKHALAWAVERLASEDRFNIVEFNSGAWALFDGEQLANQRNKGRALGFIDGLKARGGTEMKKALDLALCPDCGSPGRLRQVIFLTDGAVGNERQLFGSIDNKLGNTRLFTVGIGSAPNSYFMRRAAELGRGTFTHIGKLEEVSEKMTALFASIEAPVLTNLSLNLPEGDYELAPSPLPDLYAGSALHIAIKGRDLPEQLSLSGSLNGKRWSSEVKTVGSLGHDDAKQRGIHIQWARKRIADLLNQRNLSRDTETRDALRGDVLKLALQHHLVSPFTSLVAVDITPVKAVNKTLHSHRLKTNPPKGTRFGLPKTATPMALYNAIGLLCLLLALCLYRFYLAVAPKSDARERASEDPIHA